MGNKRRILMQVIWENNIKKTPENVKRIIMDNL